MLNQIIELHLRINFEFLEKNILPHVNAHYALSSSVNSRHYADVNLRLFDILGRFSLAGLWLVWSVERADADLSDEKAAKLTELSGQVLDMICSNPALITPLKDEQVIELTLCVLLFAYGGIGREAVAEWLSQSSVAVSFAIRTHGRYPTTSAIYRDILEHPRERTEEFRKAALPGSVLIPFYAAWLAALCPNNDFQHLSRVVGEELPDCTLQFWLPDERTEGRLYEGVKPHGSALTDLSLKEGPDALLQTIRETCEQFSSFNNLTCIQTGYWPILLLACRHYRLPVPPQLWIEMVCTMRAEATTAPTFPFPPSSPTSSA